MSIQELDTLVAPIKNFFKTPPVERPQDFPDGFFIYEYVNGRLDPTTPITLAGSNMPFQPFPWGGEQRIVKGNYPGNPEVNVQVMGPKEGDLVIKGRFKDKKYDGIVIPYGTSYEFAKAVEAMRRRGNLVKFGMDGSAGSWHRFGFLEKANFNMEKLSRIDYELTFLVISEKQPVNNYFANEEQDLPVSINQALITAASSFLAQRVPAEMPGSILGDINSLISGVASVVAVATGFVNGLVSLGNEAASSANRALGLIKNAKANISKFKRDIGKIQQSFANLASTRAQADQLKTAFRNIRYLHQQVTNANNMAALLARMEKQFQAIANTIPIRRYRVSQGDTLQKISTRFYHVPDHWIDIYNHNKLQSTVLVPGAILEIPKL